jgi:tRNA A-37 threonylcarbamoyl transferase component Bud32
VSPMDPSNDQSPAGPGVLDAEVIELEPTIAFGLQPVGVATEFAASPRGGRTSPHVALVEGSLASLEGETATLRRRRVAAAALFLSVAYAVLFLWVLFTRDDLGHWFVLAMAGVRFALATAVGVILMGKLSLSRGQVRAAEYILFGSLTAILAVSQYTLILELMRLGETATVIAYVKNGVIQMFALMLIYGMFIPNDTKTAAAVVLTMALVPIISLALAMEHQEVAETLDHMRTSEHAGSNALYLLLGAGLAIYGAHVLNGMRSDLHVAKKFGQYRLIKKLGAGGMGEVYLAEHQLLKRPCALKLIRDESGRDPLALARFEREVRSAARLSHPNSIEIFDFGHADDGTFYYVMEYLPGLSLEDLVRRAGPLPAGRVIHLLRQVCAGLSEAHAIGLIHRDLKPANVFVARRGGESDVAKVLDFGLVKLTHDTAAPTLSADLTISGTPSYMAPEQATASRDLDARADIYALGAVAYFALTGRPPFGGETAFAIMMAHARDAVVPPSQLRPDVPTDLEGVVLICLAKAPEDRYTDVRALSRALAACADAGSWDSDRAEAWWNEEGLTDLVETAS